MVEKAIHIVESTDKLFFSILKDEKNFRSSLLDLRQQNA
ncbi:hypothetical protein LEP1GSC123_3831 [Leptospira borgpetersenii str. 200701203]|uniref:Uncharacterized protein n=1 Tax=Leptospira borgpetersenii str. 200701203 TaxID=1193007 RepID=M3HTN0_LEPBO|nr:hypothetical protein LEP1GSC123_3831 [Leptospira borgpetersenii str. 200701203]